MGRVHHSGQEAESEIIMHMLSKRFQHAGPQASYGSI